MSSLQCPVKIEHMYFIPTVFDLFWDIHSRMFPWLSTHHSHMSYVVPHISLLLIIGHQGQSSFKGGQSHVVLLGIEAAQAQVVVQLAVIHPHLEQSSSKGKSILNHRWDITSHNKHCYDALHKVCIKVCVTCRTAERSQADQCRSDCCLYRQ